MHNIDVLFVRYFFKLTYVLGCFNLVLAHFFSLNFPQGFVDAWMCAWCRVMGLESHPNYSMYSNFMLSIPGRSSKSITNHKKVG